MRVTRGRSGGMACPSEATTIRRDVVVVGGGPAGSATAALLAEAGHDVLLLERSRRPRHKPCSEYTGPGTERLLARFGVLDRVDHGLGRRLRGMELRAPSGGCYLLRYGDETEARSGFSLSRPALDAALLEVARGRGVDVRSGVRVSGLLLGATSGRDGLPGVLGVVGQDVGQAGKQFGGQDAGPRGPGRPLAIRARLVVGADGRHSMVARSLRLRRASPWAPRLGLVTHYRGVPWPWDHGQMHVGPRGYVGVAPSGDDLLSVGLVTRMPTGRLGAPALALDRALADYPELAARLARGTRARPVQGVGPLACSVRACAGAGFLLVGDAAGFCDPFTGEGIHRALRGAELAAAAADHALRSSDGLARIGPEYAQARQSAFRAKERLTALVQLFVRAPSLMNYAVDRLKRRPELGTRLANALGDLAPARSVLDGRFVLGLLGPW